jgi:hypothetical protein
VRGDERVNQKWLKRALEERPCVVANAIIHYQVRLAPFATVAEQAAKADPRVSISLLRQ